MASNIKVKGIREGLLITTGDGDWKNLRAALLEQLDQQSSFYQGAQVALEVGNQIIKAADLGRLRDEISERGITLWAVIGNSPTTQQTAQDLGLATRLSKPLPDRPMHSTRTDLQDGETATLVKGTLRSGYKIQHPGHVIVLGDVNPGAEIVAGGSIIIWGHLRGLVHAGAEGDDQAVVCALDLEPTQLRIAGQIAIPPKHSGIIKPEIASLKNGRVVAEPWKTHRKK